jgi:hypothetical protein
MKFTVVAKVTLTFKTSAMKSYLPFLSIALVFASCTTAYKSSQTPDDVYYSPERPREEYVRVESKREKYRYDENYDEDRYLRMKVRNYRRWSEFDNDWYSYSPYYNRYNLYNPWNSYTYWNYYYNPYCRNNVVVVNPKTAVYNRPRQYNLHVFDDPQVSSRNPKATTRTYTPANNNNSGYDNNYRGSGSNAGDYLRGTMGSSNSSSGSNTKTTTSSSGNNNSSSGSSTNSSSGSSGSTKRRF